MDLRRAMETLLLRTRPAQLPLTASFLAPPTRSSLRSSQHLPLLRHQQSSNRIPINARRTLTTTPSPPQQAAARRRDEDPDEDDSNQPQQPQRGQAQQPPAHPIPPREPNARTTLPARHPQGPPTGPARPKPKNFLSFLTKPRTPTGKEPPSAPQSIQTDRTTPADMYEQFKNDDSLSFLSPRRPQPQGQQQQQDPGATASADTQPARPAPTTTKDDSTKMSLSDLLKNMRRTPSNTFTDTPRPRSSPPGGPTTPSGRINTDRMQLSPSRDPRYDAKSSTYKDFLGIPGVLAPKDTDLNPPTFRIGPSLGRTQAVDVNRGTDVARAFRSVEIRCAVNGVKADFNKQRFHERPGLKRKRLVMSRWRRRFREGFRATVRRVEDMRRKGW